MTHKNRGPHPNNGIPAIGPHRNECASGKVGYIDRAGANRAVGEQAAHFGPKRPYRCQGCRMWHLTSQRESERPPLVLRRQRPGPTP